MNNIQNKIYLYFNTENFREYSQQSKKSTVEYKLNSYLQTDNMQGKMKIYFFSM